MSKILSLAFICLLAFFSMDCREKNALAAREISPVAAYRNNRNNYPPPNQEERNRQRSMARAANIEWIKTLTMKFSPDSWYLLMQYDGLPASNAVTAISGGIVSTHKIDETFRWLRGRSRLDMLASMEKDVHEIAHAYFDQNAYRYISLNNLGMDPGNAQGYLYISPARGFYVSFPLKAMFPSGELAAVIPGDLRTFRFNTYIEGITSTQSEGMIGLLNELHAYYLGSRYCFDMLEAYKIAAGSDASGVFEWVTSTQSTMSAFYEFDYYMKEYLLYMKKKYPENYRMLQAYKPFSEAYGSIRTLYEELISNYTDRIKREMTMLNSKGGTAARIDKGWLWVKVSRSNVESGTPVFSDPREKLMPLLESRRYVDVENDFNLR
jgi:hypothetical protein